jgi:hypothetical protein
MVSLDEEGGVTDFLGEMQEVVGAIEAGAVIHRNEPASPPGGEMTPGRRKLAT